MNKKTTYELTITEKLAHLPLPDMEDAIWARVKAQLDLDMPDDDSNDDGDAPDTPSGSGWIWWGAGSAIFVAALLSIFLMTKKSDTNTSPSLPTQTIKNIGVPTAVEKGADNTRQPVENRPDDAGVVLSPGSSPPIPAFNYNDSALALPTVSVPLPDSGQRTAVVLPPPVAQDTMEPKKKTRGVTGITDNDYRIVPSRKDSL